MSSPAKQAEYYTVAESLDWERLSDVKSEYFDGRIVMMAVGSPEHRPIAANLTIRLD